MRVFLHYVSEESSSLWRHCLNWYRQFVHWRNISQTSSSSAKLETLKSKVLGQRPARDPEIYVQVSLDDLNVFSSEVIAMQCDMTVLEYNAIQESCSVYMVDL